MRAKAYKLFTVAGGKCLSRITKKRYPIGSTMKVIILLSFQKFFDHSKQPAECLYNVCELFQAV